MKKEEEREIEFCEVLVVKGSIVEKGNEVEEKVEEVQERLKCFPNVNLDAIKSRAQNNQAQSNSNTQNKKEKCRERNAVTLDSLRIVILSQLYLKIR